MSDDEWQPGPWKNSWFKWEKPIPLFEEDYMHEDHRQERLTVFVGVLAWTIPFVAMMAFFISWLFWWD